MASTTDSEVIVRAACVILAILTAIPGRGDAQSSQLFSPVNLRCACPGDTLMFICTIVGPGVTVWRGTAFDCSNQNNEILLRHSQFANGDASSTCNNDAISGRGLQNVTNNQFSSQLNFTVSADNNEETIECGHNDGTATSQVGINTVTVISGSVNPLLSLDLTDISPNELRFEWSPGCPAITYSTLSSGCGECTSSTGQTSSSCSIPPVTTATAVCTFTVQSMACGDMFTDQVVVNLKVPSEPEIKIVPHYNIADELTNLTINITAEDTFVITGDVNSTVLFFTAFGTVPASNLTCSMLNVDATESDCYSNMCSAVIDAQRLLSNCSIVGNTISLSVATSNQLGSGPPSNIHALNITNKFVDILLPQTNEHILTCSFLAREDTSYKTCFVKYGPQPQQLTLIATNSSTSFNVIVSLDNARDGTIIYYSVNASNSNFTVIVEGSVTLSSLSVKGSSNTPSIIVGCVFGILLLITSLTIATIAIIMIRKSTSKIENIGTTNPITEISLEEVAPPPPPRFKLLQVDRDCELKEFIEDNKLQFWRGCAFYEFIHEIENISDEQGVILKKSSGDYITGEKAAKRIGAPGEGIRRPKQLTGYTVYVQSIGSGARHLSPGSSVLYENQAPERDSQSYDSSLMPVDRSRVQLIQLAESCTFGGFTAKHEVKYPSRKVYLEAYLLKSLISAEDVKNVIIIDQGSSKMFTGGGAIRMAKQIVDPNYSGSEDDPNIDLAKSLEGKKMRVLVCHKFKKKMSVEEGSLVLIQNTPTSTKKFVVQQVNSDEDCVQMSEFIKRRGYKFENRKAYYEFVRDEEDIFDDTEIVLVDKKSGREVLSGPDTLKQIPGAPGWRIKRPALERYQVFVQSKSQGSRCLRAGTFVVYDVSGLAEQNTD